MFFKIYLYFTCIFVYIWHKWHLNHVITLIVTSMIYPPCCWVLLEVWWGTCKRCPRCSPSEWTPCWLVRHYASDPEGFGATTYNKIHIYYTQIINHDSYLWNFYICTRKNYKCFHLECLLQFTIVLGVSEGNQSINQFS